jgi:hypothetical protein
VGEKIGKGGTKRCERGTNALRTSDVMPPSLFPSFPLSHPPSLPPSLPPSRQMPIN